MNIRRAKMQQKLNLLDLKDAAVLYAKEPTEKNFCQVRDCLARAKDLQDALNEAENPTQVTTE